MNPLMIAALAQSIPGLIQMGKGIFTKEPPRPTYEVPYSFKEATKISQQEGARGQMRGYGDAMMNIDEGLSNAALTMSEFGNGQAGVLGNLASVYERGMGKKRDLAVMSGQQSYDATQRSIGQLNMMGQQETNAMMWNDMDKYIMDWQRKQALTGAGIQNTNTAMNNFMGAYTYGQMYPSTSKPTSTGLNTNKLRSQIIPASESLAIPRV